MRLFHISIILLVLPGGLAKKGNNQPLHEPDASTSLGPTPTYCASLAKQFLNSIRYVTPFCASILEIHTSTSTTVSTYIRGTLTVSVPTITKVIFSPGQPPSTSKPKQKGNIRRDPRQSATASGNGEMGRIGSHFNPLNQIQLLDACSCLRIMTPMTTISFTIDVTKTLKVASRTLTKIVYPCATPLLILKPTIPYGVRFGGEYTIYPSNSFFPLVSAIGNSTQACCNACYFEVENCIQAWWYSSEGCWMAQAQQANFTGEGVSRSCPSGKIKGLGYVRDRLPPFGSTGDIAGPCGENYENL